MKRNSKRIRVVIIASIILLLTLLVFTVLYDFKVDTLYAIKYGEVLNSYDISQMDKYLNPDTEIIYQGRSNTYSSLRNNVETAFIEKLYIHGSSYGHASPEFGINGELNIGIYAYVESDKYDSTEVEMVIERTFWIFYRVKSIKSNDSFFGYLFFREL